MIIIINKNWGLQMHLWRTVQLTCLAASQVSSSRVTLRCVAWKFQICILFRSSKQDEGKNNYAFYFFQKTHADKLISSCFWPITRFSPYEASDMNYFSCFNRWRSWVMFLHENWNYSKIVGHLGYNECSENRKNRLFYHNIIIVDENLKITELQ